MINGNNNDNSSDNNHEERHPCFFDDASSDEGYSDEEYNYDAHDGDYLDNDDDEVVDDTGNNNDTIINITTRDIKKNQKDYTDFLHRCQPIIGNGEGWSNVRPYTRQLVIGSRQWLITFVKTSFESLSQRVQSWIGNRNPAQACLLWSTRDLVTHFKGNGQVNFIEDDIANLTRQDIKNTGVRPIAKTFTKAMGSNSLLGTIGGKKDALVPINMETPTLLRNGVAVAFLHDESVQKWDDIDLDEDSENKLVAVKAEAERRFQRALAQACLLWSTRDLVTHFKGNGQVNFIEDDIANLTRQDIKNSGVRPIAKAFTKAMGSNSLLDTIGGRSDALVPINMETPTLLRNGVAVAFLHDESVQKWDDIDLDEDSENKLVAVKAEAERRFQRALAQACLLWSSNDLVTHFKGNGQVNFIEDDIANLTRQDIKNSGVRPIAKTFTKITGSNSLLGTIEGDANAFVPINMETPTLLRNGVAVAFLHDESVQKWDDIDLDEDSENKLVAVKAEAERRHYLALEDFSIYDAREGVLLKKVNGVGELMRTVGGCGPGMELPGTTAGIREKIQEGGGEVSHRKISETEKAFHIRLTPENCTQRPAENGEARLNELMNAVRTYVQANTGGMLQNFHWLIYPAQEGDPSQMGDTLQGHGKGISSLLRKLAELTPGVSQDSFKCHWKKSPTDPKINKKLSQKIWNEYKNDNGTLYNTKANKWVKVVTTEHERLQHVGNDNLV